MKIQIVDSEGRVVLSPATNATLEAELKTLLQPLAGSRLRPLRRRALRAAHGHYLAEIDRIGAELRHATLA